MSDFEFIGHINMADSKACRKGLSLKRKIEIIQEVERHPCADMCNLFPLYFSLFGPLYFNSIYSICPFILLHVCVCVLSWLAGSVLFSLVSPVASV